MSNVYLDKLEIYYTPFHSLRDVLACSGNMARRYMSVLRALDIELFE